VTGFDAYRTRERAELARLALIAAFLVLAGAFFRTQIVQHDKFQLKAETNRLRPIPLTAPRGAIYDRNGRVIAENVPGYSVKLIAPSTDSLRAVLARVRRFVPLDDAQIAEIIERFQQARYQPALVFGDASFDIIARLEEHRSALPGLVIQAEPKRLYPAGKAVAHLAGYVSEVTEADLKADRYPGAVLGSIVGKAGLEREYDDTLRGNQGVRYIEVNARGRLVREGAVSASLAPTPGNPIITTIDLELQRFIDSIWPPRMRGAMVALTPSGEVRALYSAPTFDQRPRSSAAQSGDSGAISAGLPIQARNLRDGIETRADQAQQ
jgi:penicillin-binding protein 2